MKLLYVAIPLVAVLAGCNTMRGVGQDLGVAGQAMRGSTERLMGNNNAQQSDRPVAARAQESEQSQMVASPSPPLRLSPDTVRVVQERLRDEGLYQGPIDGIYGVQTRTAVANWQRGKNLQPTGQIDDILLRELNVY